MSIRVDEPEPSSKSREIIWKPPTTMTTTAAATASVRSRSVSFLGCLAPDLAAFFPSAELAEAACAARRAAAMKSGLPVPGSGMTGGFGSEAA